MKIFGIPVATPIDPVVVGKENTQTIVQELLKPENTTLIVEQVLEQIPGHMVVDINVSDMTAGRRYAEIVEHLGKDGSVVAKLSHGAYATLYGVVGDAVLFRELAEANGQVEVVTFAVWSDGTVTRKVSSVGGGGKKVSSVSIYENTDEFAIAYEDGSTVSGNATFDENGLATSLTDENGNAVDFTSGYPISATGIDGNTVPIIWG